MQEVWFRIMSSGTAFENPIIQSKKEIKKYILSEITKSGTSHNHILFCETIPTYDVMK